MILIKRAAGILAAIGFVLLAPFASQAQSIVSPAIAQVFDGGTIYAIAVQPADGKVVVGGSFAYVNGTARKNLARFNTDGSLDSSWNPGADAIVKALAVDNAGNLYVGGDFTTIGGQSRSYLAKLSSAGTVDVTWNPSPSGTVYTLAFDVGNGNLYVGGQFGLIGGQPRPFIARLASGTGTVDGTWNPTANAAVHVLRLDGPGGNLYAGGDFTTIGGFARNRIARLSTSGAGSADSWAPQADSTVRAIRIDAGQVFVGGDFSSIGGQFRTAIAKISAAGTGGADTWNANVSGWSVHSLDFDGAGNLYAAGIFSQIGGQTRDRVAKLSQSSGLADAAWNAGLDNSYAPVHSVVFHPGMVFVGGTFQTSSGQARGGFAALSPSTGASNAAWPVVLGGSGYAGAISRDSSGRTVIGGPFMALGDKTTIRLNIARFNADGSVDSTWNPGADGGVYALAHDAAGNVFAAGSFKTIGSQARMGLAKLAGSGSGAADATWNPAPSGSISAMRHDGAGGLFVGGYFTSIGGQARNNIAKLSDSGAGAADASWNPNADNSVQSLVLDGAGNVFVAGGFLNIGGQARNRIAKLSAGGTGTADPSWNPNADQFVHSLALDGTSVFAGGSFANVGGQARAGLVKLSTTGTGAVDATWAPGVNAMVEALAADGGGYLYVGGGFTSVGGVARDNIARVSTTGIGSVDSGWNPAADGSVVALLVESASRLHVGGYFRNIAGQPWAGYVVLASLSVPGAPTIGTATAGNAQASVAFTAPASDGGSPITGYTVTSNPGGLTGSGTGSPITVTGLTNGTAYTFTVTATNAVGTSAPSAASNSVTPATIPGAPTIGAATAGNAQATVSFTAPTSNGGSAITGYVVASSPGGITASGSASPITVSGLTNGTAYTFTVAATNAVGTGPASAASNSVTPATTPGAPTIGSATAGDGQASVTFTPPASNGGSTINGYTVTSSPGGITASGAASPIIVTGLTNGTAYTFTVTAANAVGTGPPSAASNSVTPSVAATLPGAPIMGTAVAANAQATVSFSAPASNGGSPITSYTVTSSPGGVTATGAASPITVLGLTNGTAYTFTVTATNAIGTGPASAASNSVTPATTPGAPVIGSATAGNGQASVSFSAPASDGGAAITGYSVTSSPGSITGTGSFSPITVTGLTNGTAYTFTVRAINAMGAGPPSSASNSVTPSATTVPSAPVVTSVGAGDGQATLSFTAPASDGGSPITGYVATCNPGAVTVSGGASPVTVTGLTNGVAYTCTVAATNSVGTGPSSNSVSVTPAAAGATGPISLSTNTSHTLAVDTTGKVYAWGNDSYGQLGQGRRIFQSTPTRVPGLPASSHVALSGHGLAVDSFKQVWSWGDNSCGGQLGPREDSITSKPGRVIGASNMTRVAAGLCYSLAVRSDGSVWGWGFVPGYSGASSTGLRQLSGLTGIVEIAAGTTHALALKSDGTVWAFGDNTQGQLGLGTTGAAQAAIQVPGLANVTAIAAGREASLALLSDGQVLFWGKRENGAVVVAPTALPSPGATAVAIALGVANPVVARADGTVAEFHAASAAWTTEPGFAGIARVSFGPDLLFGIDGGGQLYGIGGNTSGELGLGDNAARNSAVAVPGFAATTQVATSAIFPSVLALKSDGSVWFWGADTLGQSGDGSAIGSSVPLPVSIPTRIKDVATGERFSVALDVDGNVWGWGDNSLGAFGSSLVSRSSPTLVPGISDVRKIAAGSRGLVLYLKNDGTVWKSGTLPGFPGSTDPMQVSGLANVVAIEAGTSAYALRSDGVVFAWGMNSFGELGNGSTTSSATPVAITGISGAVAQLAAGANRAAAITSGDKVWTWGSGLLGNGTSSGSATPVEVPGIADAADIALGAASTMVRRTGGGLYAWANTGLDDATSQNTLLPYAVAFFQPVQLIALGAGHNVGFIVGSGGLVWGFGFQNTSTIKAVIGDGSYVARKRPVVVHAANGAGSVDSNDWYFDLDASSAETIPAASVPRSVGLTQLYGSESGLSLQSTVKYKSADIGRKVNNYVLAQVPAEFFGLVKNAPGTPSIAQLKRKARGKAGVVLAMLTPAGWTNSSGQLIAYSQATANAAGSAVNILNGINAQLIPGSRFCIGYGESSGGMLSAQSLTEVLSLEGAASSESGVPCVLTGLYVDGPTSSTAGSSVSFRGSVVGLSPTGTVQFKDGAAALLSPVTLSLSNEAVGVASIATSALSTGVHSIGGLYAGDSQNASVSAEVPVRHEVVAAAPGQTVTTLSGASSSDLGSTATFSATVAGASPSGSVQFKDGAGNLGEAVPLVGGMATLRNSALALGSHSITVEYSGDSANAASTSSALSHTVYPAIVTTVALSASPESADVGTTITLTATVTGTSPTGTVTFRDGGTVLGSASLAGGVATLTLANLESGGHAITAEYGGDSSNQAVSSSATFVSLTVPGQLNVSPAAHDFGGQSLRTTQAQAFTVFNTTAESVAVTSVSVTSGFAVSHDCSTLAVGGTCTATVSFTPTAEGAVSGSLSVVTSAGTKTVTISGTGEKSLVTHYYRSILRRAPDAGGKAFWEAEAARVAGLGANVNETWYAMAMSFYNSSEYLAFGRNPTEYVRDLYNTFFNRTADDAGLAYWTGLLAQGMPREVVLVSFMFSTEFSGFAQAIFGNTAARAEVDTVVDFYRGLLSRLPDSSGFNFWVGQFRTAQCQGASAVYTQVEAISSAYANSPEYGARARSNSQYIGDLYNAFLRRGGDLEGVGFWIGQLDTGAKTREQVRQDFVASPEFNARVNAVVAQGCIP